MKILLMIFKHTQKDIKIEISECPKISLFQRIKCKNVEDRRRNPKRELGLRRLSSTFLHFIRWKSDI